MKPAYHAKRRSIWGIFQIEPYIGRDRRSEDIVGGGEGLASVVRAQKWAESDFDLPAQRSGESVEDRFARLVREWKTATAFHSSVTEMATDPAYQKIIGMGEKAVPLILEELAREPNHWFWALHAITGINPVPAQDAGHVDRMAAAWLNWGRTEGYCL